MDGLPNASISVLSYSVKEAQENALCAVEKPRTSDLRLIIPHDLLVYH